VDNLSKTEAAFKAAQRERDDAMHRYETILDLLDEPQRVCDECRSTMSEGYCIGAGWHYYCSDACLHKHYTPEEWEAICADDDSESYYTEWETADYEELDDAETALEKAEQALTAARLELGRARFALCR
jgi:hypothetical protein